MDGATQDERYVGAAAAFGPALARLARAYEADPDQRRDLVQELHLALWRSLAAFDGRCSLRTWVYRVAHNAAASYVLQRRRANAARLTGLEDHDPDEAASPEDAMGEHQALQRLMAIIRALRPPDAQVMLYLEDLDAASIGEITGMSAGAVATKIHRIKSLLANAFRTPEQAHERSCFPRRKSHLAKSGNGDAPRDARRHPQARRRLPAAGPQSESARICRRCPRDRGFCLLRLEHAGLDDQARQRSDRGRHDLRRMATAPARPDRSGAERRHRRGLLAFHREELVRQRDAVRAVWRWYLLPFLPGMALLMLGRYLQVHAPGRTIAQDHMIIVFVSIIMALVFVIILLLNLWGAAKLQNRIHELDRLKGE